MPVRTPTPSRATAASNLVSGIIGGLVVLALGATLIGTGLISAGDTHREIIREVPAQATSFAGQSTRGPTVADIYRRSAPGVRATSSSSTR